MNELALKIGLWMFILYGLLCLTRMLHQGVSLFGL
jgi:hypothetical protein